ncbi:hypothetical protein M407DRAFT_24329 [Tulasnella calospora MUT 4182]|uniref:Protein kinase domain-containing protein n=1 Tax=Tulasnella calospora MUT 4182 TaxID=1051891 RepID=A0A0C3KYC3_9AGAM|nr:hypothetical protein M407DRAFT_24329 [Tulasnella calospora MUT 4182]
MPDEESDVQVETTGSSEDVKGGEAPTVEERKLAVKEILAKRANLRIDPGLIKLNAAGVLGKGGKGDVSLAILKRDASAPEEVVAVKQLRPESETDEEKFSKAFAHEVDLLADLSHPNIVQMIGFIEDLDGDKAWVIFPWEANGNVREFLASGEWEIPERISLIHSRVSSTCTPVSLRFVMATLNRRLNILVSSTYRATITDFGSARFRRKPSEVRHGATAPIPTVEEYATSAPINLATTGNQLTLTGPAWSLRWAAPEILLEDDVDLPSDIWAAGWVAWEIMTNKVPFADTNSPGVITLKVVQGELPSIREDTDLSQIIKLGSLLMDCWSFDPKTRPTASECFLKIWFIPYIIPSGDRRTSKVRSTALLLQMAAIHSHQGRNESATSLFQQALAIAQPAGDKRPTAEAFRGLANIHLARSKYFEAEESFTKARDISTELNDDLGIEDALRGLGEIYRLTDRLPEAEQSFLKAKEICSRIGDPIGENNALRGLGDIYRSQGRYAEAEGSYTQSKGICTRIGDYVGLANALSGLGNAYRLTERYTEAERSFLQARDACARTGDDLTEATVLRGLGNISDAQTKYAEAVGWFTQAEAISARIGDHLGRAHSLRGLGTVYLGQEKYEESEKSFVQAGEVYVRLGNKTGRANVLFGLGNLRREQARYSEALVLYAEARDIYAFLDKTEDRQAASNFVDAMSKELERLSPTLLHNNTDSTSPVQS